MKQKTKFQEVLIAALVLIGAAILFVTIVGYFDEGHARTYGSFANYLVQGGVPPLSDYLLWSFIILVLGLPFFVAQGALPGLKKSLATRLVISAVSIPLVLLGVLAMLMTMMT